MTARTFRISTLLTALVVGCIMIWTILAQLPLWLPMVAALAAITLKVYLRKRTQEPLVDERLRILGNRAMALSFQVFIAVMAVFQIISFAFIDSLPSAITIVATTLAYSAGLMMVVYLASYYIMAARS